MGNSGLIQSLLIAKGAPQYNEKEILTSKKGKFLVFCNFWMQTNFHKHFSIEYFEKP